MRTNGTEGGKDIVLAVIVISTWLATSRLTSAGAVPARRYSLFKLVGFKQTVIMRQFLFNAGSSFLAWVDLSQK